MYGGGFLNKEDSVERHTINKKIFPSSKGKPASLSAESSSRKRIDIEIREMAVD